MHAGDSPGRQAPPPQAGDTRPQSTQTPQSTATGATGAKTAPSHRQSAAAFGGDLMPRVEPLSPGALKGRGEGRGVEEEPRGRTAAGRG